MLKARSAPLSLRANFSWTFVGNVVYAGCQWGMLSALAKLGTPEMVGRFSLGLAITAPVIMFTNLQLRAVQATDAKREYAFGDYLGLRLIMTAFALLIIAGITLVTGYPLETALVILVVGLAKAFESISDVFYGLLQQRERMDRIAKSMIIKGLLSLVVLGTLVYLTGSVLWGSVGLAMAWALILLTYDVRSGALILRQSSGNLKEPRQPRWVMTTLAKLAWLSLPLGIVMMLISLNTNIPRYFVEWYWGERELGIFAAMAYLLVAGNTVVSALGQSAGPRLSKYYADGDKNAFRSLLLKLIGVGILLGVIGVLIAFTSGRYILSLLYTPEYGEYNDVFELVMIAAAIGYITSFLGYGMTAARYFRIQLPLNVIFCLATLGSSLLLIPSWGLQGAAWVAICTFAVQVPFKVWVIIRSIEG